MGRREKRACRRWAVGLVIVLLTLGLLMPAPTPALAANRDLAVGCAILGLLATPLIGYGVWRNLPQNRGREGYLNGEWYAGGFMGASITPNQDLRYADGFSLNPGNGPVTRQGPATLLSNRFANSLVGGLKLGYFTQTIPYLGLEVESMVNNSYIDSRPLSTNRPIQGASVVAIPNDFMVNWTTVLHIMGRYGFLPDGEVPFGRLKPYAGIGPAFIVLYDERDSAKNFGLDLLAGLRYMITKHISTFVEYKFNYQWDVGLESHIFYLPNGTVGRETANFGFACHKIVAGLAYHG
jgi:opacity protein-like surface antigen